MKIVLIGATGFIGKHLVKALAAEHELFLVHRGKHPIEGHPSIITDRKDLLQFREKFANIGPDLVIDLIPYFAQDAWDVVHTFRGITEKVIAISSGDVYRSYEIFKNHLSPTLPGPAKESDALRQQLFPYRGLEKDNYLFEHYDKILVEQIYLAQSYFEVTILRLGALYGAYDSQRKLAEYITPMRQKAPVIQIDPQKAQWKWTRAYIRDVVYAIQLVLQNPEQSNHEIFNMGELNTLTQIELIQVLQDLTEWQGKVEFAPNPDFNYQQHLLMDTQKIRTTLGFQEQFSLEEGLMEVLEWET